LFFIGIKTKFVLSQAEGSEKETYSESILEISNGFESSFIDDKTYSNSPIGYYEKDNLLLNGTIIISDSEPEESFLIEHRSSDSIRFLNEKDEPLLNRTILISDSESDDAPEPERFSPEQPKQELLNPSADKIISNKRAKREQTVTSTRPKRECKKSKAFQI